MLAAMKRALLPYALAFASAAFGLVWLERRVFTLALPTELHILAIALGFLALGIWAGQRLTPAPKPARFEKNEAAMAALGVTAREYEVLALIAAGRSNKEIARILALSPNTVKTHAARLYEKLGAARRTEAVEKARALALLP